jgi:OOP family OmpA-OmpF porin
MDSILTNPSAPFPNHQEFHTDNQGSADYNQRLSQLRADAIVTSLVNGYAIASNRLAAKGMGATSRIANNDSDDGRAKNRRVELVKQ